MNIQYVVLIRKKSLKFNGLFDELILILLHTT